MKGLFAIPEIQPHFRVTLGLVLPAGAHFDLQEQMDTSAQEFFKLGRGRPC